MDLVAYGNWTMDAAFVAAIYILCIFILKLKELSSSAALKKKLVVNDSPLSGLLHPSTAGDCDLRSSWWCYCTKFADVVFIINISHQTSKWYCTLTLCSLGKCIRIYILHRRLATAKCCCSQMTEKLLYTLLDSYKLFILVRSNRREWIWTLEISVFIMIFYKYIRHIYIYVIMKCAHMMASLLKNDYF